MRRALFHAPQRHGCPLMAALGQGIARLADAALDVDQRARLPAVGSQFERGAHVAGRFELQQIVNRPEKGQGPDRPHAVLAPAPYEKQKPARPSRAGR